MKHATYALIQDELEARGVPARISPASHGRVYIAVSDTEKSIWLDVTAIEPTLTCEVLDSLGAVVETIESTLASDTTDVKAVADWIATTYSEALAARGAPQFAANDPTPLTLSQVVRSPEVTLRDSGALVAVSPPERIVLGALTDQEQGFLLEGLQALLKVKQDAFAVVTADAWLHHATNYRFTERDFGIPQIRALSERLTSAFYGENETEVLHENEV